MRGYFTRTSKSNGKVEPTTMARVQMVAKAYYTDDKFILEEMKKGRTHIESPFALYHWVPMEKANGQAR